MSMSSQMYVTIWLPTRTIFEGQAASLYAVAENGAFGILPNHIDFITALVPSVLTIKSLEGSEMVFGIDEGLLVKKGHGVDIAVRRGVQGAKLETLQAVVEETFLQIDEEERTARSALSLLEANMVRRFAELRRPRK